VWFHLHRAHYRPGPAFGAHTQDFPEVFWIDSGTAVHEVNGRRTTLATGDLVVMRPGDQHAYGLVSKRGFTLVNAACRAESIDALRRRYFEDDAEWPWAGGELPAQFAVGREALARLDALADDLARSAQSRLALDAFLLGVLKVTMAEAALRADNRPPWLVEGLRTLEREPARLRGGAEALAAAADRSIEHVNRTVRRCYGQTATELVNALRIERAARLLRMTDLPIAAVAYDAGYEHLGYFYQRFAEAHGTTPRKYRLSARAVAG